MAAAQSSLTLRLGITGATTVVSGLGAVSRALQGVAGSAAGVLTGGMARMVAALTTLTGTLSGVGAAYRGVQFNTQLKETRAAIASLLLTAHPERFKDFNDALQASASAVELLKQKAVEAPGSFLDMATALQSVYAMADAAGLSMEQATHLVVRMTQTMNALRIPAFQARQEINALLTGVIDRHAAVAQRLNITREQILRAREEGRLYQYLMERTAAIGAGVEYTRTLIGTRLSNIRDQFQQFLGELTTGLTAVVERFLAWVEERGALLVGVARFIKQTLSGPERFTENVRLLAGALGELFALGREKLRALWEWFRAKLEELLPWLMHWMEVVKLKLVEAVRALATYVLAAFSYLGNVLVDQIARALNRLVQALTELAGSLLRKLGLGEMDVQVSLLPTHTADFQKSLVLSRLITQTLMGGMVRAREEAVQFWRRMTVGAGASVRPVSHLAELMRRIRELLGPVGGAADPRITMPGREQPTLEGRLREMQQRETALRNELAELEKRATLVRSDFRKTEMEKQRELLALYEQEEARLSSLVSLLESHEQEVLRVLGAEEGGEQSEQIRARSERARQELIQLQAKRVALGPSRVSPEEQLRAAMTALENEWGGWSVQVALRFKETFQASIGAISDGLSEVIMQTRTWGEALYAIGMTIRTAIVKAIVQMGVEFVMTQGLMRAAARATAVVTRALGLEQQAQHATTLATGAAAGVGTSGAMGGWVGVLIYLGVLTAALASVMAMTGGFASGGYTGDGRWNEAAGIVHRGEFVFSRPAVEALGVARLESLHQAARTGAPTDAGWRSERPLRVVVVDNRRDADRLMRDPAFRNTLVSLA